MLNMNTANAIKPVCRLGTILITTPSRVPDHLITNLIMMTNLVIAVSTRHKKQSTYHKLAII